MLSPQQASMRGPGYVPLTILPLVLIYPSGQIAPSVTLSQNYPATSIYTPKCPQIFLVVFIYLSIRPVWPMVFIIGVNIKPVRGKLWVRFKPARSVFRRVAGDQRLRLPGGAEIRTLELDGLPRLGFRGWQDLNCSLWDVVAKGRKEAKRPHKMEDELDEFHSGYSVGASRFLGAGKIRQKKFGGDL